MGNDFYRVIFYWNSFNDDGGRFSDCSTNFHVMGPVFKELPTDEQMHNLMLEEDLLPDGVVLEFSDSEKSYGLSIKRFAEVGREFHYREEKVTFVGAINVPEQYGVIPVEGPDELTKEIFMEAVGQGDMGIANYGYDVDENEVMIMSGHEFEPLWKLHGYETDDMEENLDFEILGFDDENFQCDGCCALMSISANTFAPNRRIVDDCEQLGVSCGCFKDYCLENIYEYIDNVSASIDPDAISVLVANGKAIHHSDLCYGWTCTREEPSEVLREFYEFARLGGADIVDDEEDGTEGVLFQVDSYGMFDTSYSLWVYRDRQNTEEEMTKALQECYEETTWLKDGGTVTVVNSGDPAMKDAFVEMYPDYTYEYTMYAVVILTDEGKLNMNFAMSEPAGSAYNALRTELIEMDVWENIHDPRA